MSLIAAKSTLSYPSGWLPPSRRHVSRTEPILVLERLPDRDLPTEELAWGAVGEDVDGDGAAVLGAFVDVGEEAGIVLLVSADFISAAIKLNKVTLAGKGGFMYLVNI